MTDETDLKALLSALIDKEVAALRRDMERLIDERNERYEQRFLAQEKAVAAALTAAKEAVASALAAAKEAVAKAEASADKRFEAVNEFRAQLADQSLTFLPRPEANLALGAMSARIDDQSIKLNALIAQAAGWVGKSAGQGSLASGLAVTISIIISIVAVGVAILSSVRN